MTKTRYFVRNVAISTIASFTVALIYYFGVFASLDWLILDWHFRLRPAQPAGNYVTIIAIDDKSIAEIGQWPWPREIHARIIKKLFDAGCRVITFDVWFREPDVENPAGDRQLGLAAEGKPVVFASMLSKPADELLSFLAQDGFAILSGFDNVPAPQNGAIRSVPRWWKTADGDMRPSLSIATILALKKYYPETINRNVLDLENYGRDIFINFPGGNHPFPVVSFVDVLNGEVPLEKLRGRVAVVGITALGLRNQFPVSNAFISGAELLATTIENLINDNSLKKYNGPYTLVAVVLFGLAISVLMTVSHLVAGTVACILLVGAYYGLCFVLFSKSNIVCDFVAPAVSATLTCFLVLAFSGRASDEGNSRIGDGLEHKNPI